MIASKDFGVSEVVESEKSEGQTTLREFKDTGFESNYNHVFSFQGGRDFLLYATVRVNGSELTAKYQVWAKIIKSGEKKSGSGALSNGNSKPSMAIPSYNHPHSEFPNNLRPKATSIKPKPNYSFNGTTLLFGNSTAKSGDRGKQSSDGNRSKDDDETESTPTRSSTVKTAKEPELIPAQEPSSKLIIALIPSIVIVASLLISGIVACLFRKKICKKRNKIKKDDMVRFY